MQSNWFQNICKENVLVLRKGIWVDKNIVTGQDRWSFSQEWKQHADEKQIKTWGLTAEQRVEQFYIETRSSPAEIKEKIILDAGCGNGLLTKALAGAGACVVGIDMHSQLPGELSTSQLQFVQADFDTPPFKEKTFDIVIANGSTHHTRNTFTSFQSLASLVKEGGKLYVWLYKKPSGIYKRFLLWWLDFFRFIISRLPVNLQKFSVNILTTVFYILSRIRKGENSKRTREEIRINIYDAFTPRYRHYQNPIETAQWFYKCKFDNPSLTHWDNQYGFGMFAVRNSDRSEPAGENFIK